LKGYVDVNGAKEQGGDEGGTEENRVTK